MCQCEWIHYCGSTICLERITCWWNCASLSPDRSAVQRTQVCQINLFFMWLTYFGKCEYPKVISFLKTLRCICALKLEGRLPWKTLERICRGLTCDAEMFRKLLASLIFHVGIVKLYCLLSSILADVTTLAKRIKISRFQHKRCGQIEKGRCRVVRDNQWCFVSLFLLLHTTCDVWGLSICMCSLHIWRTACSRTVILQGLRAFREHAMLNAWLWLLFRERYVLTCC